MNPDEKATAKVMEGLIKMLMDKLVVFSWKNVGGDVVVTRVGSEKRVTAQQVNTSGEEAIDVKAEKDTFKKISAKIESEKSVDERIFERLEKRFKKLPGSLEDAKGVPKEEAKEEAKNGEEILKEEKKKEELIKLEEDKKSPKTKGDTNFNKEKEGLEEHADRHSETSNTDITKDCNDCEDGNSKELDELERKIAHHKQLLVSQQGYFESKLKN